MARRAWRPKPNSVLNLGAEGLPVAWLQERLQSLGYDVGAIDGIYGYLTEDCISSLQREFGLKPDGIAGPQVIELLQDKDLEARRFVHVVEGDALLADIAQEYGVTQEVIELWNPSLTGKERVKGGTPLVLHRHGAWGGILGSVTHSLRESSTDAGYQNLDGLLLYHFSLTDAGDVSGQIPDSAYSIAAAACTSLVPVISNFNKEIYDAHALEVLLRHRPARQRLLATVKLLASNSKYSGLALDLQGVEMGYGRRFAALIGEIRALLQRYHKRLYVTLLPSPDGRGLFPRHIDPHVWTSLPHRVILQASLEHVEGEPGPRLGLEWLQTQLSRVYRYIPAWKLMVVLPLGGIAWRVHGNWREYNYLSYDDARRRAYEKRAKLQWDVVEKVPYYDYIDEQGRVRVWFENRDSLDAKLTQLRKQHLTEAIFMPLGWEDSRIWGNLGIAL